MDSNLTGAEFVSKFASPILDILRDTAHAERRELVNLYTGQDRAERIASIDRVIGIIEEEQAKRSGLASVEDILAAFSRTENLSLTSDDARALPQPKRGYQVGQRVICTYLPHIGATVTRIDSNGVALVYDTDSDEERGTYGALFGNIRPMPHL